MTPEQIEEVVKKTIESLKTSSELVEIYHKAAALDRMHEKLRQAKRKAVFCHVHGSEKYRVESIFNHLLGEEVERQEKSREKAKGLRAVFSDVPTEIVKLETEFITSGYWNEQTGRYFVKYVGGEILKPGQIVEIGGELRKIGEIRNELGVVGVDIELIKVAGL